MIDKYRTPIVLGLLAAIGMGVVVLFSSCDQGQPIQVALPTATQPPEMRVYITGAVKTPGVYPVQPGARIDDAIKAAGGATEDADLLRINLAGRVRDAQQIHVPKIGESSSELPARPGETQKINLNTAPPEVLDTIPGVGRTRAQRIVESRTKDGPFTDPQQLVERKILPSAVFDRIKDRVYVD